MKTADKSILLGLALAAIAAAFYFMILSPKRSEISKLGDQITELQGSIAEQEQVAQFAEQARHDFPHYYGRLVVLGKAVPEEADTASMLVQLSSIADRSSVDFQGIQLGQGSGSDSTTQSAPAPATTPSSGSSAPASTSTTPSTGTSTATPAATASAPVPATEASAASLPIGAVVGPAGLPTLPYDLTFRGGFFQIADFIGGVDGLVHMEGDGTGVAANGRLLTIDGFALKGGAPGSSPTLDANFAVTSYVTPAEQGLTAGAGPSGPAPTASGETQVAVTSGTVSK